MPPPQQPLPLAVGNEHFQRSALAAFGQRVFHHLVHPVPVQMSGQNALHPAHTIFDGNRHIQKPWGLTIGPGFHVLRQQHCVMWVCHKVPLHPPSKPGPCRHIQALEKPA